MPDDYYGGMGGGDGGGDAPMPKGDGGGGDDEGGDDKQKQDDGEPTALLPNSLMAGKDFKPGDEIVMQIVHVYEGEFEVKYAPDKPDKKGAIGEADDELAGMGMGGGDDGGAGEGDGGGGNPGY